MNLKSCLCGDSNIDQSDLNIARVDIPKNKNGKESIININNEDLNKDLEALKLENQKNKQIINSQKIEIEKYKNINQDYLNEIQRLKETISKDGNISNQYKKLNQQYLEKNEENQKLKLNLLEYEKQNKLLNEYNTKLKLNFSKYENQSQNQNTLLNQKNEEIRNLKNEINNLNKKIEELQNKIPPPQLPVKQPTGLNNIGATCYMNATLQCLANTKKLTDYFLKTYLDKPNNTMSNEYHKLILNLNKNYKTYSPNSFKEVLSKENPLFAGIAANDSKDLINFLLEKIHQELNKVNNKFQNNNSNMNVQPNQTNEQNMLNLFFEDFKTKFDSPISNLFYGVMETKSQCHGCQTIKYNFQVYSFLEFPLQEVNKYYFSKGLRPLVNNDGSNPDVDLYECFDYYGKIDLMNGDNQMFCNICNRLNDAFYSTSIYSAPLNLIINLNRGKGAVYACKVNFPEQLNLFNFVSYKNGITVFELYAVICHLGPSSMSGHFVAYCKYIEDNKWYLYNDGIVTKCTKKYQYQDGMPYILFYRALQSS